MPTPSVVVHIGLHKTATRYLQRGVFAQLDPAHFLVNPEPLARLLRQAVRHHDPDRAHAARQAAAQARREAAGRTLLLSDPSISGDMYSSHGDYGTNLALIEELFPDARIIYFVRRHADWLQSAYRQSLKKGRAQSLEHFLNFYDGEFRPRTARTVGGVRNVEALRFAFDAIYRAYADRLGADRVYLFRQEDLRQRWHELEPRLAEALGLSALPATPGRVSGNRSFSALAIRLFIAKAGAAPRASEKVGEQGRAPSWWRDMRGGARRLRGVLIQHVFDRLIYRDWDLLEDAGIRKHLEAHYALADERLAGAADRVLVEGPGEAARRAASSGVGHEADAKPARATVRASMRDEKDAPWTDRQ